VSNPVLDQERVEFLRARVSTRNELLSAWPRPQKELRVVEVRVDWVRFSTLNHRTRAEQLRAIHESKRSDLFTADPLGTEAQAAQYKILCDQRGFDDLKSDLRERRQQEPAVITAEGVLINGNRRTAALRSLYLDEHHLDAQYVRCLLLPEDATAAELVDLEAELQIAKDFKEEYSWVNEAMLIEELFDREGRSFAHVARKMHRDEKGVKELYEKLQQLHQLVALSKEAKLHIDFAENESAFDELAKHIKNKPKPEQESVRAAYFLGTLAGVNYRMLRHLRRPDAAGLVYQEMNANKALRPLIDTVAAMPHGSASAPDDPLDDLFGDAGKPVKVGHVGDLLGVLGFLATKARSECVDLVNGEQVLVQDLQETIRAAVEAAAVEAEEDAKDSTVVNTPIARLDEALQKILRAVDSLPRARTLPEWNEADLQSRVEMIRSQISRLGPPPK
jgi:hypothetical protein